MMINLAFGALLVVLLQSLLAAGAAVYGGIKRRPEWVERARWAMMLTFPLLTYPLLALVILLLNNHFELLYVTSVSSRSMPFYLRIAALWGGQAGSLLLWVWLMAAMASAVSLRDWSAERELLPWVMAVLLLTLAFFLLLLVFFENPFVRIWQLPSGAVVSGMFQPEGSLPLAPLDGQGLNPLLHHFGMLLHPPLLYLGFISLLVPFAFALSSLISEHNDDGWLRITRGWILWGWLLLSLGLVLGSRWAYDVLGWGGYWGWDAVEVAGLLPWLLCTALLHSVMGQLMGGGFKRWNLVLVVLSYNSMNLGTFLTRSGVLSSVHAFAQSAIGPYFFIFTAITLLTSLALLAWRWESLRSEAGLDSLFSREGLFILNNLLFLALFTICLWGIVYPLISEVVAGRVITLGPVYYEKATAPIWLALLLMMGITPLSVWGAATARSLGRELWKPALISLAAPLLSLIYGIQHIGVLLAVWFIFLALSVMVIDLWRIAIARRKSSKEGMPLASAGMTGHNRRRGGGIIIHLGVLLMAAGIIGIELFQTEAQASLPPGDSIDFGRYQLQYDSSAVFETSDELKVTQAVVKVYRQGRYLGELQPRQDHYYPWGQTMLMPAKYSTLAGDLYVLFFDQQPGLNGSASFQLYHNPLINWLWLGSLLLIAGTLLIAWPKKEGETNGTQ